ncbi:MAG: PPOX class F420-dependent oxidoreductase [Anaerolineales bacterium]|jgi:PPOX class probable F420-dependent enzyme
MQGIDKRYLDLFADETRAFAFLASLMPDGSPQVTPVWFNTDGEHILVNSAKGRVKDQNMRRSPQVALVIMALDDPYRYVQVRGEVVEIEESGAEEHIHALSMKYRGRKFEIPEGQTRVRYKIRPY